MSTCKKLDYKRPIEYEEKNQGKWTCTVMETPWIKSSCKGTIKRLLLENNCTGKLEVAKNPSDGIYNDVCCFAQGY